MKICFLFNINKKRINVLAISNSIEEVGSIKLDLLLCLLIAWFIVYLSIFRGMKNSQFVSIKLSIVHCRQKLHTTSLHSKWTIFRWFTSQPFCRMCSYSFFWAVLSGYPAQWTASATTCSPIGQGSSTFQCGQTQAPKCSMLMALASQPWLLWAATTNSTTTPTEMFGSSRRSTRSRASCRVWLFSLFLATCHTFKTLALTRWLMKALDSHLLCKLFQLETLWDTWPVW